MQKKSGPKVLDLFAGAGLFSYSFKLEGFNIIRAIELDVTAAQTYAQNLGAHIEVADVSSVKPNGKFDVIIAGPPCQGFSTLNRKTSDKRNSLSLEVLKWTKVSQPSVIVIENVAGFIQSNTWQQLTSLLRRMKYSVITLILNAADFGVAQLRSRSFTIATRVGFNAPLPTVKKWKSVAEAWNGLATEPTNKNNHYAPMPSPLALARMKVIPAGGDKRDIMKAAPRLTAPSWWGIPGDVTDVWGRMDWNSPCNTLRTSLQNPSKGRYIHPEQHRVISLREAARLHSIPDSWQFYGYPTQVARQIGNSVPPKLGRSVAAAVRESLS